MSNISLWLLPHSVVMQACEGADLWQNPTWGKGVQYPHVKVQSSTRTVQDNGNTRVQQVSVLYIPALHAPESPETVKLRSEEKGHSARVLFEEREYTVESVSAFRNADGTVHHWKVGLL